MPDRFEPDHETPDDQLGGGAPVESAWTSPLPPPPAHPASAGALPPTPAPPPGPDRSRPRRRLGRTGRAVAALVVVGSLVAGGYGLGVSTSGRAAAAPARVLGSSGPALPAGSVFDSSGSRVVEVVRLVEPAVVNVTATVTIPPTFFTPAQQGTDVGTGFVVAADGLILTNAHVVESASHIVVTLADGRRLTARVVALDSPHDLAVLRVNATGLRTVALGRASTLQPGQPVVAIGYALGMGGSPTVTTGIVSSTGRTIQAGDPNAPGGAIVRTYRDAIQTSAAINPGNSGGPLIDMNGRVVGIDAAGANSAQNIGFAIPIEQAAGLIARAEAALRTGSGMAA